MRSWSAEGPKDDLRVLFVGLYYRGQRREDLNESTSRSTIPSTNVCRACGNCPTRGPRPRGARPPRNAAAGASSTSDWTSAAGRLFAPL